jgi:hypothetical protein
MVAAEVTLLGGFEARLPRAPPSVCRRTKAQALLAISSCDPA